MLTGNREFNEIYEKYKNLVLKAAYIYSGDNYDAAQDITQETFLKLYTDFEKLKTGNIPAWLYTTAQRSAFNLKKKRKWEILTDGSEIHTENETAGPSVEAEYMEKELNLKRGEFHERILEGLLKKNPRWHEAIILVYYMEIPQAEAAEIMGIRLAVLHSILHRAKKWIKNTYGAEYEEMKRKE